MSRPIAESDPFRAIADPTRRRVLVLLRKGPAPVGELLTQFRMSWPNLSHHLRILRNAGLVTQRRRGRYRMYQLNPRRLKAIEHWVSDFQPSARSAAKTS